MKKLLLSLSVASLSILSMINPSMASDALSGTSWKLISWGNEKSTKMPLDETEITLQFENNQISGSSSCNRYFASYTVKDEQLKFGVAGRTQMACPEEIMKQEDQFLSALEKLKLFRLILKGNYKLNIKQIKDLG